ncbi:NUDIX hydrolase [Actinosynnema pretiosum]|uniref:NUDIX hydrolase n=1 Tax=Actinosynnema pretiosum TaxID=42197 RepID=A0A290Z043_9PSEU|nr:NUDIX domain-containing protein [Actinosynnema pretiosum]ATE52374.1 NUDIX hydrolase [Actinosynnema pretiosum]
MSRIDYFYDPDAPKANSLRPAVSAFIQNSSGDILMIRRTDNDKYAIPGGTQDAGESLTQAAIREVKEETGVTIKIVDLIGIYSNPNHVIAYSDGEVRQEFSICFRARFIEGDLRTSNESKEVLWVKQKNVDLMDIHPSIRMRIDHGLNQTGKPYFS